MSLRSELESVAARASSMSLPLASEEAVKQSLVLPLLSGLGYDTVGLSDIIPEFPVGGGRVDYALLSGAGGLPVVFVECKRVLDSSGVGQLRGYMAGAGVGVGVLTDGVVWEFFDNREPFFVFDIRVAGTAAESAFAGFAAGRDIDKAVAVASDVGSLVGLYGSAEGRAYIEEAVVAAVRCVVAGAGGDAAAVKVEGYPVSTSINVFYYAEDGKHGNRRRLVLLDFWKNGPVYLSMFGAGGNQDLVNRVRLRAVGDIARYAADIRAAAFREGV